MPVIFGYDLHELLQQTLRFAAMHPWQFIYYVLLVLSPLFFISAFLAWKLAKEIQQKEKDKKRRAKREANIAKTRRHKAEWPFFPFVCVLLIVCKFFHTKLHLLQWNLSKLLRSHFVRAISWMFMFMGRLWMIMILISFFFFVIV